MSARPPAGVLIVAVAGLVLAGCSSSSTLSGPATSPPGATGSTPTTTGAPAPLMLRPDGIGPIDFNEPVATVLAQLDAQLGRRDEDQSYSFPNHGDSWLESADGEIGFSEPFGRQVCYGGLCVLFGGSSAAELVLRGWRRVDKPEPPQADEAGVHIGSPASAAPSGWITLYPGGCYQTGYGKTSAGVELMLISSGVPFMQFDDDGQVVTNTPPLSDLTVIGMNAGEQLLYLYEDC